MSAPFLARMGVAAKAIDEAADEDRKRQAVNFSLSAQQDMRNFDIAEQKIMALITAESLKRYQAEQAADAAPPKPKRAAIQARVGTPMPAAVPPNYFPPGSAGALGVSAVGNVPAGFTTGLSGTTGAFGSALAPFEYSGALAGAGAAGAGAMQNRFANGGQVGEPARERYNGVYNDAKVKGKMPRVIRDYLKMAGQPGHSRAVNKARAAEGMKALESGLRAMANGGPVTRKKGDSLYSYAKACHAMANGGAVRGPGTGTSDSVKAVGPGGAPFRLSDGEYVLSADTVRAVGKHNLDALQARYHKPV